MKRNILEFFKCYIHPLQRKKEEEKQYLFSSLFRLPGLLDNGGKGLLSRLYEPDE